MAVTLSCAAFSANNPVPYIVLPTVPSAALPGGPGFTLMVNGAGFVNGAVVNWNGSPRSTTFISTAQLTAEILASDVAIASTASITVTNPLPGGGTSSVAYFEVTAPAGNVTVAGLQLPELAASYAIAADLNNDGKLDLVLLSQNANGVFQAGAALGNGDGTFQTKIDITGGVVEVLNSLILGDFNGDGKLDVALIYAEKFPSGVSIFLGNGDGTFQAPIVSSSQNDTYYTVLAAGDFNQDGKLDLVTNYYVPYSDQGITILFGNGDGSLQAPVNYSTQYAGSAQITLTVSDFNGDGILDLGLYVATTLLGNGDGTFQAPVLSSGAGIAGVQHVSAGDVNGDGKQDLLFSSIDDHPFQWWARVNLGDGHGGLSYGASLLGSPALPPSDFDGDGKLDFVISTGQFPFPADDLSIWIGNGDGTFSNSPVAIVTNTGLSLNPLVQGDFNGDGKMDLIASDQNGVLWIFLQGFFLVGNVSRASLDFGSQTVGTTSPEQIVNFHNTGSGALTLSPANISGVNAAEFKQINNCPSSLPVGGQCQIRITFRPTAPGSRAATLNIPNDGIGSQTVALSGSGDGAVPTLSISPIRLDFPIQVVGTAGSSPVTLSNPGPGTVSAPTITVSGTNADDFSEQSLCTSDLPTGGGCKITVTFKPTAVGPRSATLDLTDNASGSPQSVPLTGSGPDFSVSDPNPSSLTVSAGQTANYTFALQPLGSFSKTVTLSCMGAPSGARCIVPAGIPLDGSSEITVAVSVTTSAHISAVNRQRSPGGGLLVCSLLAFPFGIGVIQVRAKKQRDDVCRRVFLLLLIIVMIFNPACGGGNSGRGNGGTDPGTYPLTVNAQYSAAGITLSHKLSFTLMVR